MNDFTIWQMVRNGWPVLSILAIASVLSWTIICDRIIAFRRSKLDARSFAARVVRTIEHQGLPTALSFCQNFPQPIAKVISEVLLQQGERTEKEQTLRHAIQAQIRELQNNVAVLGTIGSTAPFIGLLGTVIGIVKAFQDIASNIGGGPEVVSAGIAEALITTAAGLLVAIPAIIGYNYCIEQVHRLADEIDLAGYDLIDALTNRRPPLS